MKIEEVQRIMRAIIDQRRIRRAHMAAQRRYDAPTREGGYISRPEYIKRTTGIWARYMRQEE